MPRLALSMLGPFQVALDGHLLATLSYEKGRALLAYLALQAGQPHSRELLATLLWPDLPEQAARTNLRQVLAAMRQALADHTGDPPFLLTTPETITFNPLSDYVLDVAAFQGLLSASQRHIHRGAAFCSSCARRYREAIAIYGGDFLAQVVLPESAAFEEWVTLVRERLHQQAVDALSWLMAYDQQHGQLGEVMRSARRLVRLEPWNEEAHQQMMRALWQGGQRGAALIQYERCRLVLARELGVAPAPETTVLYDQIRDGAASSEGGDRHHAHRRPRAVKNAPAQATMLIGREGELEELGTLLEDPACRLITLVGPGGIGKTRLALAAAEEQAGVFGDGTAFVPLAGASSTRFVATAILSALDVMLHGQRDPLDQLVEYLRGKELLLVLDNVEQLLAPKQQEQTGVAELLSKLQERAAGLTLLVTSRARLYLPGEWVVDVAGLDYPEDTQSDALDDYSAAQLFLQCARRARTGFVVGREERPWVARICRLVEGMPLGIELAAAWVRAISCHDVAQEIARSLDFLSNSGHAVLERHRSMRAVLDQSWNLLTPEEQQVLRRLSVFAGGAEREAAAEVAGATPVLLVGLVDKSLLRWDGTARYNLHELVRQYAGEKLTAAVEAETVRRRHADHYLALTEHADCNLWAQSQFASWLARLSAEHDNLRAALVWSQAGDHELSLRLVGALNFYWMYRSHIREANYWIAQLLASEPAPAATRHEAPLLVRAKALRTAGNFAAPREAPAFLDESTKLFLDLGEAGDAALSQWFLAHQYLNQGAHERANQLCELSQQGFRVAGDMTGVAWCLWLQSNIVREQGDLQRALTLAENAHTLAQELRLPMSVAYALFSLTRVRLALEDMGAARSAAEEALALGQQLGMPSLIPQMLLELGRIAQAEGDIRQAAALWEQALVQARDVQHHRALGEVLLELGWLEHRRGNEERALALLAESLRLHRERGDRMFIAESLAGIASVCQAKACTAVDMFRVVRLYAAAQSEYVANPAVLRFRERIGYAHDLAAARSKLDGPSFAAVWAEGQAMTLEESTVYALEEVPDG